MASALWLRWQRWEPFLCFIIVRDKVTRQCPCTDHNFWEKRAEADSNRGPSAYQPNALPLGQTGSRVPRKLHTKFHLNRNGGSAPVGGKRWRFLLLLSCSREATLSLSDLTSNWIFFLSISKLSSVWLGFWPLKTSLAFFIFYFICLHSSCASSLCCVCIAEWRQWLQLRHFYWKEIISISFLVITNQSWHQRRQSHRQTETILYL